MRNWLTPRCIVVALMLVAAPVAALAHILIALVPGKITEQRLASNVVQSTAALETTWQETSDYTARAVQLEQALADENEDAAAARWMSQRASTMVFDAMAEVFDDPGVSIDQLTFEEPALFGAADRQNLLACERCHIVCMGSYASLTECLDRLNQLTFPLHITDMLWARSGEFLRLELLIEIPFVPDEGLREALADQAGLEEDDE